MFVPSHTAGLPSLTIIRNLKMNVCMQAQSVDPSPSLQAQSPLAEWWFVHPHVSALFADFVNKTLHHKGGLSKLRPKGTDRERILAFGEQHAILGRSAVVLIYQFPGDIVHIAPGWLHCVSNLLPCCKVAWEFCDCRPLACYTAVHRDISSKLFKGDSAHDDCIATAHILTQAIEQLFEANFSGSAR